MGKKKASSDGYVPKYEVLPLAKLISDGKYQRYPDLGTVSTITIKFNPRAVGPIPVSLRKNGKYAVLDKQQCVTALRQLGHKEWMCEVMEGLSRVEEAEIFLARNSGKPLSRNAKFRAAVAAGVRVEATVAAAIKANELEDFPVPGAIMHAFYNLGPTHLDSTLKLLRRIWTMDATRVTERPDFVTGLALFVREHPNVDHTALVAAFSDDVLDALRRERRRFASKYYTDAQRRHHVA